MPSNSEFPKYDETKTYLVSGKGLNAIIALIKRGRAKATANGGIKIDQENEEGVWLSAASNAGSDLGGLAYPTVDGTYVLGVVVTSGVPALQWIGTSTCT